MEKPRHGFRPQNHAKDYWSWSCRSRLQVYVCAPAPARRSYLLREESMNECISCGAGANPYIRICLAPPLRMPVPGSHKRAKCSNSKFDFSSRATAACFPAGTAPSSALTRRFAGANVRVTRVFAAFHRSLHSFLTVAESHGVFWLKPVFPRVPVRLYRLGRRTHILRRPSLAVISSLCGIISHFLRETETASAFESRPREGPRWRQANEKAKSGGRVPPLQNVNRRSTWSCCHRGRLGLFLLLRQIIENKADYIE